MLPVLLESFPAPPSFIPSNPPPTAPPSVPLPPVPTYVDSDDSVSDDELPSSPDVSSLLDCHIDDHDDGDQSDDSSIDLHTPLPHLMLRHGLLSPNSKLLARASSSVPPSPCPTDRPGSVVSMADSVVTTKTGIIKDSRDTARRRVRHRDGKLLKGGIGLTTGLGWSDSEDEDAPSALTKRISSLNLRKSMSSLRSSSSSSSFRPLSHSQSHSSLASSRRSKTPSLPPTSWSRRAQSTASSTYSSSRESFTTMPTTPSSASSVSFPIPTSPTDEPTTPNRDKLLPSLPNPKTGSIRRPYLRSMTTPSALPTPRRRSQTLSSGSSSSGSSPPDLPPLPQASNASTTNSSTGTSTTRAPPRALRLPSRSVSTERLAIPSGPATPLRFSQQRSTLRSAPTTPTGLVPSGYTRTNTVSHAPAGIPIPRLQPRTGTGMVYKTSPATIARPPPSPTPIRPSMIGIAL